jgi:hypothetical protein
MNRLLRRIKRAHRTSADAMELPPSASTGSVPSAPEASAEPGSGRPLPAGQDPADVRPTALRRGRLRKRLRYLERERELLLRDLGGVVYEIHRTGDSADRDRHRDLVSRKVRRLAALDSEHRAGLAMLGETRGDTVLREAGVGGVCPRCGEMFGSDARFCPACGTSVRAAETATSEASRVTVAQETSDLVLPAPEGSAEAASATGPGAPETATERGASTSQEDPMTAMHRPSARRADEAVTEVDAGRSTPADPQP